MSHITTMKNEFEYNNLTHILNALRAMQQSLSKGENQFTFSTSTDNNKIAIRYKPIETYQHGGNMTFEKNKKGIYDMKGDPYNCNKDFQKVRDEFNQQYQLSIVQQFNTLNNMMAGNPVRDKDNNILITARVF
jgi:hypothetical protein